MLKLQNIAVSFGSRHVLQDLSCEVEAGDFIVILGVNGAGKSSFFDVIAGKNQNISGSILLDGVDITALNEMQRADKITRIFQSTRLNSVGTMTVAQNFAIAHYCRRSVRLVDGMTSMPRQKAERILQDLAMPNSLLDVPMQALSGGQRQLLAFAMSMQHIPKILLLDEPTAALDPQAATKLLLYAKKFIKQHKVTTLMITHDPQIALSMGNKIWILENGKISKQFTEQDKQHLHPDNLIGHINYQELLS